ncbi:MAG: hypothetical protein GX629_03250 [Phycisphaerae bacterium]|jgi:hypothetical protein|nr:hypothetical protein [Phycisphaerae bacterium]
MKKFRYDTSGTWYKGNTHAHSTLSDGGLSPQELGAMYEKAGFDFLFRTDHWISSNEPETNDPNRLLWINGIEIDGPDPDGSNYHVVCLGNFTGLTREMGLKAGIESALRQNGLIILAHPHWMGNTLDDAIKYPFHGVEVYNHVCRWSNGKSDGAFVWDSMLIQGRNVLGFASDDTHGGNCWHGGWIVVNAKSRTVDEIMSAIRAGNYYSSCGPDFHKIEFDGQQVHVETSPVSAIRLVGPRGEGKRLGNCENNTITHGTFEIPPNWSYARLEIEDEPGRRAWSNTLLV